MSLTREELRSVVAALAPCPDAWAEHVHHDPERRVYHELRAERRLSVWVISWMPGHDTGLHDHGGSSGAVAIVKGTLREDRVRSDGSIASRVYSAGELLDFAPGVIHRVRHEGTAPAVSLHAYSPRLDDVGAYELDAEGRLVRRPQAGDEELRPAVAPLYQVTPGRTAPARHGRA